MSMSGRNRWIFQLTEHTGFTIAVSPKACYLWPGISLALETAGRVPGIDERKFQEKAEEARKGCLVSAALAGVEITLQAKLQRLAA